MCSTACYNMETLATNDAFVSRHYSHELIFGSLRPHQVKSIIPRVAL